jgi:negative regulator of flagellin synthesis FlgM
MSSIERLGHHEAARTYLQNAEIARAASQPAQAKDADSSSAAAARRSDSVSLSDYARSLAAAREAVQNAPDVRGEKVAEIKQRVEDGTYTVPAHVLARKLIEASANS